jgi:hypothetical protein
MLLRVRDTSVEHEQGNLCVEDPGPVEVEHGETPLLGGHRVVGRPIALDTVALPNTSGACLYELRESDGP